MKLDDINARALDLFHATGLPQTFQASQTDNGMEIQMYDVIGSVETNAKTFSDALDLADGCPVTIRLSSPGGSVFDGWAMYNTLKEYGGETTCVVDGVCASIASVIALAADTVRTQSASMWMVHNAWLATIGNSQELRDTANTLDKIDVTLAGIYADKTNSDATRWADLMAKETWFTSDEALAAGLVDEVIPPAKPAKGAKAKAAAKPRASAREALSKTAAPAMAAFDPDGDGDDDAAEALGLIQSAQVLLDEAAETLTGQPDEDDTANTADAMDKLSDGHAFALELAKAVRVRRGRITALISK
jgi:ATP-dependent protease ClpP protease subunit